MKRSTEKILSTHVGSLPYNEGASVDMRRAVQGIVLVLLFSVSAPAARADTVVNTYSGLWNTALGGSTPGTEVGTAKPK